MGDDDRTAVRTYVPQYQKDAWVEHADSLGMSQSEFVRTMVQAGRRDFEIPAETDPVEGASDGSDPGGDGLETRLLDVMEDETVHTWEDLLSALSEDMEERLDDALGSLQERGRVRYSGRAGGYELVER
jgi:hypothetical protein